jgi:hypothetical protein
MGSDVMSLYTEKFNIENQRQSSENKMMKKKFAFSVHFTVSVNCVFVGSVSIHVVIFFGFPYTEYVAFVCGYAPDTQTCFFSCFYKSKLKKDPAQFQMKDVMGEFKNACEKFKIMKMDLVSTSQHFYFGIMCNNVIGFSILTFSPFCFVAKMFCCSFSSQLCMKSIGQLVSIFFRKRLTSSIP